MEPPRGDHALPGDERGVPGARCREAGERRREPKASGSAAFVSGVFGLAAAGAVVQRLTGISPTTPREVHEVEQRRRRKRPARTR